LFPWTSEISQLTAISIHEEESIIMASAAQIEANRANAKRSTGPRSDLGKSRSRLNSLDHGFRANLLVLPTEQFGEYEKSLRGWRAKFQPTNAAEEFLVQGLAGIGCQIQRIRLAHTCRLATRQINGDIEADNNERAQVAALGERLFQESGSPRPAGPQPPARDPGRAAKIYAGAASCLDPDGPSHLIIDLDSTLTGCAWQLEQWGKLRALLETDRPWVSSDKLKAVRLLGRQPTDARDEIDVAHIYLASHVLRNQQGNPFQEILNELPPEKAPDYAEDLKTREYESRGPKDAAAAKAMLLDIVDRTMELLEERAEVLRDRAERRAVYALGCLAWDDTPEGDRLRRYEATNQRTWSRIFDILDTARRTGQPVDNDKYASIRRSIPTVMHAAHDRLVAGMTTVKNPTEKFVAEPKAPSEANSTPPEAPSEANSAPEKAPNEPNSPALAPSTKVGGGIKELRIDTPHRDHRSSPIGTTGRKPIDHDIDRVLGKRNRPLLNLSPIFGKG
jgi:hypothetical protein